MPDVRHTSDPPTAPSGSLPIPNVPSTPSSWSNTPSQFHQSTPEHPSRYSLPAPHSYASATRNIYPSSFESPLANPWPTYSTSYPSAHEAFQPMSYSASPPTLPSHLQPVFVAGGKSRYMDYYNPMTHANSSTESFLYSSDDSHLHSHSQQTSEESARYEDQSNLNPFKSPPIPSTSRAPTSQTTASSSKADASTSYSSSAQHRGEEDYTYHLYPLHGAQLDTQHGRASPQPVSSYSPRLGGHDGQRVQWPNSKQSQPLQARQQQRRVGHAYTPANEASTSHVPSTSHQQQASSSPRIQTPRLLSELDASMYHTREGSSFSSSASDSVESDPLLRQDSHHDGRPKRPLNAFMIYSRSRRGELLQERPDLKATEIAGALAGEWRELETTEKAKFQEMARVVKEAFHKNNPNYVFSRRANGSRSKKSKMLQALAGKTTSKRAGSNLGQNSRSRDADDSPFSPEEYNSSASSTSSFYFGPRDYSPAAQSFRRPGTSASQGSNHSECFAYTGTPQSASYSRHTSPALPEFGSNQSNRSLPLQFDPLTLSDSAGNRSSSTSVSPSAMRHSSDWQPSLAPQQNVLSTPAMQPSYATPPFPSANWSDRSSGSSAHHALLTNSPAEEMPPPSREVQQERPLYARQHASLGAEELYRSNSNSMAPYSGEETHPFRLRSSRPGTPYDLSPPRQLQPFTSDEGQNGGTSSSPVFLAQCNTQTSSNISPSPSLAARLPLLYQPLSPLPTFSRPHTIPSPSPAQWSRTSVFPHRSMPAAQPPLPAYDGQGTWSATEAYAETSSHQQQAAPGQSTMPTWMSSPSEMDADPI